MPLRIARWSRACARKSALTGRTQHAHYVEAILAHLSLSSIPCDALWQSNPTSSERSVEGRGAVHNDVQSACQSGVKRQRIVEEDWYEEDQHTEGCTEGRIMPWSTSVGRNIKLAEAQTKA